MASSSYVFAVRVVLNRWFLLFYPSGYEVNESVDRLCRYKRDAGTNVLKLPIEIKQVKGGARVRTSMC
jgi:hypothetical protein